MKRTASIGMAAVLCLSLSGCAEGGSAWPVVFILLGLMLAAVALVRTYSLMEYNRRARRTRRRRPRKLDMLTWVLYGLAAAALLGALLGACTADAPDTADTTPADTVTQTEPPAVFTPAKTAATDPESFSIRWEIFQGDTLLHSYSRSTPISFGAPEDYFALPGIATFRGNNYRNSTTYGTAVVEEKSLSLEWTAMTSYLRGSEYSGSAWAGSGWTGQPLMVKWDESTKAIMNLYPEKKEKADLVEVIYATLDGCIYFLDLEDGAATRDPIDIGLCFKGAGSLDPRGWPIMYVGAGDVNPDGEKPRMYIISLIDGSILYQGGVDDPLSYRRDNDGWCAFDSAPLVSADTDTLIWPGENGLLYTIKLNTGYDQGAGKLSIAPDAPVVTRYHTGRSSEESYWYGYEASASIMGSYLYVSENGGMFYCVDLNTMELVWAQDTRDDTNSSPVFEYVSAEEAYVYTAPSLHWTKDASYKGTVSIYKLNALTGEIVWEKPYDVHTVNNLSGGIQSTPLLGKPGTDIQGMLFYTIARTPDAETGLLVALDTATGEELWRMDMAHYAWSSPVAVYEADGTAYVVACDTEGTMFFLDGATGTKLDTLDLGGTVQATPAVYENMLVVGNRVQKICGIKVN